MLALVPLCMLVIFNPLTQSHYGSSDFSNHNLPSNNVWELLKPWNETDKFPNIDFRKSGFFGLEILWCDVTTGRGQKIFEWLNQSLRKNASGNLIVFSFKINQVNIHIFGAVNFPSNVRGWQGTGKKWLSTWPCY